MSSVFSRLLRLFNKKVVILLLFIFTTTLIWREVDFILLIYTSIRVNYLSQKNHFLSVPEKPSYISELIQKVPKTYPFFSQNRPLRLKCESCAIVFSSGHLLNSSSGAKIDSHACVVRFNDAPSGGDFSHDVGEKTTLRFLGREAAKQILFYKMNFNRSLIKSEKIILYSASTPVSKLIAELSETEFYYAYKNSFTEVFKADLEEDTGTSGLKLSSGTEFYNNLLV